MAKAKTIIIKPHAEAWGNKFENNGLHLSIANSLSSYLYKASHFNHEPTTPTKRSNTQRTRFS